VGIPGCRLPFLSVGRESLTMIEPSGGTSTRRGFTGWRWVAGGALYGLLLRILFGALPSSYGGPMSVAFLLGTPIAVGALTIYGDRAAKPTIGTMLFKPWMAIALMLIGCGVTLLEGSICLALLSPLFLVCSSLGGLVMGLALRLSGPKQSKLKAVALLPFLLLVGEGQTPLENNELELRRSVVVDAEPHAVWLQILAARSIRPQELPLSLVHLMGVPKPVEGINVQTPSGEMRFSKWERGVNFRAIVTNRIEDRTISWHYIFDDRSFPAGSMDEHVAIGGRYFALRDTTFNLMPLPGGRTQLEIVAHHRVTTNINFYAVPAATLLGYDFINTILTLYKSRSERAAPSATDANDREHSVGDAGAHQRMNGVSTLMGSRPMQD